LSHTKVEKVKKLTIILVWRKVYGFARGMQEKRKSGVLLPYFVATTIISQASGEYTPPCQVLYDFTFLKPFFRHTSSNSSLV
jgi:hypothetical protein